MEISQGVSGAREDGRPDQAEDFIVSYVHSLVTVRRLRQSRDRWRGLAILFMGLFFTTAAALIAVAVSK